MLIVLAWLTLVAFLVLSLPLLPTQIGDPGKTVPALGYVALMAGISGAVQLLLSCTLWRRLGRCAGVFVKLPNRHYWMALERRDATLARLDTLMLPMRLYVLFAFAAMHAYLLWCFHPGWPRPQDWIMPLLIGTHTVAAALWHLYLRRAFTLPKP